jgi:hypothetical protein
LNRSFRSIFHSGRWRGVVSVRKSSFPEHSQNRSGNVLVMSDLNSVLHIGPPLAFRQTTLMIIQAARKFACTHRYVVTATDAGNQWLFVCETCDHRAEELPLTRDTTFGEVLAFPSLSAAEFSAAEASGRHPDSLRVQSA